MLNKLYTPIEDTEIDLDHLLKWMKMIFDDSADTIYKQELYNIYVTIHSDYIQYKQWKNYNNSLYLPFSFRKKDTKALSKKMVDDVKLFKECLEIFSLNKKI